MNLTFLTFWEGVEFRLLFEISLIFNMLAIQFKIQWAKQSLCSRYQFVSSIFSFLYQRSFCDLLIKVF